MWLAAIERAGGACECSGECGQKHGRERHCTATRDTAEIHAAPLIPVNDPLLAPKDQLRAVCDGCHGRLLRKRPAAEPAQAEALF